MTRRRSCAFAVLAVLGTGVALAAQSAARSAVKYEAMIRRTSYGIPHITASDFGSLGFGEGYAFAQDHLCSLADQVVLLRGERAKLFGAGEKEAHVQSDVAMKALRVAELGADDMRRASGERRDALVGYAAGYNAYLAEVGRDGVAGWCRGAAWVQPITAADVAARARLIAMTLAQVPSWIATASPPAPGTTADAEEAQMPDVGAQLSNGWAIGKDRSETRRGLLLANPHYPWVGSNRFWEKHLTIPSRVDVYGVSLLGSPGVAIGFNSHVAWTHTVSAGTRMTGYSLKLLPGAPTSYLYNGQPRQMTTREVQVDVRQSDGSMKRVVRTVYFSHYGPVVNFPGLPWTATRAVAIRDANADNDEGFETYSGLASAATLEDVKKALARGGTAFVNTMVATADGRAFYVDAAAAPHLSDAAIKWWRTESRIEGDVKAAHARGLMLLDGSDPTFEWVNDARARDPGIVPTALAPQLERPDYIFNANDSYWLSHARVPLTGYSPVHGPEATARSLRTRMNARMLDDATPAGVAGADGRFSIAEVWAAVLSNRSMSAELLRGPVVERCQASKDAPAGDSPMALADACRILAAWDGRFELESRGAVLWREFITQFRPEDVAGLFSTPFDAADPIGTPQGLAPPGKGKDVVLEALARAIQILQRAQLSPDVSLGQVQYARRGDRRIPVHGGLGGEEGVANFVNYGPNRATLEPDAPVAPPIEGSRYLTRDGYPINRGSSFVMVVGFTDAGPRGRAVLTYGQSGDPQSPHFSDQTELFSQKAWREILYTDEQIRSDPAVRTKVVSGSARE